MNKPITHKFVSSPCLGHKNGLVILVKNDSLAVAINAKKHNKKDKILVLNFANNESYCDDRFYGSTQEEDLARRTNLGEGIIKSHYPISNPYENPTYLLTKNVQISKDKDMQPIEPIMIDIISSAAIKCPRYSTENYNEYKHNYKYDKDRLVMVKKIENIVRMATYYDVFITGAWGMGQFCNPKYGLIKLWNEALETYKVPTTIFGIPDNRTMKYFKQFLNHGNKEDREN